MPPVAQSVFAETPGISGRFTAGRHECLPYSVFKRSQDRPTNNNFLIISIIQERRDVKDGGKGKSAPRKRRALKDCIYASRMPKRGRATRL